MCIRPLLGPLQRAPTLHTHVSSQVFVLRFCKSIHMGSSTRARMVRCRSSLVTAATISRLFAVHYPQFEFCWRSFVCSTKALCHCQIVKSPNVSFPNASFNNVVVLIGVFFKRTQNLIVQHCSADASIFSKYSAAYYLAIHECSASYALFFFFLHVDCCTHLLLHFRAFYQLRKFFLLSLRSQSFAVGVRQHAFK